MANVVEIAIQGTDLTEPAFKNATAKTRALGQELKTFKSVVTQTGNVVATFGGTQLSGAISQLESMLVSSAALNKELGKSKAAFAALAVAGIGVGLAASESISQAFDPAVRAQTALQYQEKYLLTLGQVYARQLQLKNQFQGMQEAARLAIVEQINSIQAQKAVPGILGTGLGGREGFSAEQVANLTAELNKLAEAQELNFGKEMETKATTMLNELINAYYQVEEASLAANTAEAQRHSKQIEDINALVVAEQTKNQLIEQEDQVHQAKMRQNWQNYQEFLVQREKANFQARLHLQQQYAEGTATIFGNLATAAAAFGKKGFAVWKGLKIAEAIASTYAGAARALADYPWPFSIAVAASVVAAGIANVASIAAAKPGGQAHGGLDYVPSDSTFLLKRGERVIQPEANEDLTKFLQGRSGANGGDVYLDGVKVGRVLWQMSRNGMLQIDSRAVA